MTESKRCAYCSTELKPEWQMVWCGSCDLDFCPKGELNRECIVKYHKEHNECRMQLCCIMTPNAMINLHQRKNDLD